MATVTAPPPVERKFVITLDEIEAQELVNLLIFEGAGYAELRTNKPVGYTLVEQLRSNGVPVPGSWAV